MCLWGLLCSGSGSGSGLGSGSGSVLDCVWFGLGLEIKLCLLVDLVFVSVHILRAKNNG